MTMPAAFTSMRSSINKVLSSTNVARPLSLSVPGRASTSSVTKATNRSRSARTRSITARRSTLTATACIPNAGKRATACAASAGAIRSLLGMHPTLAQVVPCSPPSISSARLPAALAARNAARPAVPAPMTATSVSMVVGMLVIALPFSRSAVRLAAASAWSHAAKRSYLTLGRLLQERGQVFQSTYQAPVDEYLRHCRRGRYRPQRLGAYGMP